MTDTGVIFTTDPTAHDTCDTCLYSLEIKWPWTPGDWWDSINWSVPTLNNSDAKVLSIDELNAALINATTSNNAVYIPSTVFIQFEFQKVGDTSYSLILKPSDIEQPDGSLSFDGYTFSDGLYKVNIFYSNNVLFPVFFESIGSGTPAATTSLSSFLSATIYPVPITNNEFSINFSAQEDIVFTYEMFDLNGVLLSSRIFNINNGEEIIYHTTVEPGIVLPSNMLVNKFSFEDESSFTIQTIKSIY